MSIMKFSPLMSVFLAVILWSIGGLFIKLTTVTAYEANLGRCIFAAITILALTKFEALKANKFTILQALFYVGALSFFALANKNTTAANAIFLQCTAPIYILLLAPIILRESFKSSDLVTVFFCLVGMSFFFFDYSTATILTPEQQFYGNILGLLSGVCLAGFILLLRHPKAYQQIPSAPVFYGNLISIFIMLPFVVSNPSAWTNIDFISVAILGIFQIGISYFLFTKGVAGGVRGLDASIIGYIEPILNPIWVYLFIGEAPSGWALVGGVVIISAVTVHTIYLARR